MIIDLPSTTTAAVNNGLIDVRERGGAVAVGRVLNLVIVTDDAKVVAVAEPVLEQCLLQEVDILVLVDGEREILSAERRRGSHIAVK